MATRLAPLEIVYDVASNDVIKNLIARGGVATMMRFGTVIVEVDAGVLAVRPIVNPQFLDLNEAIGGYD